jgi:4-amino-4-deoxy-L-arabinose transferase-like glycosyltransferase
MQEFRFVRPSTLLGGAALVALCLVVYLPGFFSIPPVDRDESRFAQASRQMFESAALAQGDRDLRPFTVEGGQPRAGFHSGGLVIPMLQDRPRLNKPPLIYWLQAASAAIFTRGNPFRDEIWMYRVPSLLAAIAAVLMTWRLGASVFDARAGWLGAVLLAVCPVVVWEAHQARADMVLLAWTVMAMWGLWEVASADKKRGSRAEERGRSRPLTWALVFWIGIAGGVMTKGPITPMVATLAAVAYSVLAKRWRWLLALHAEFGVPLVILSVAPWVWGVAQHVGFDKYRAIVVDEVLGRSVAGKEGHWAPPGYHLVLFPVLFWPGSLMTAAGLGLAWRAARAPRPTVAAADVVQPDGTPALEENTGHFAEAYRFCLAWIVPAWIVFELVSTKLPHYTLPLYSALAVLSARALFVAQAGLLPSTRSRTRRIGALVWQTIGWAGVVCLLAWPAVLVAGWIAYRELPRITDIISAVIALLAAAIAAVSMRRTSDSLRTDHFLRAQLFGVVASVAVLFGFLSVAAPHVVPGFASVGLAAAIRERASGTGRPIASVYHEDSLIFHLRGRVERIEAGDALAWIEQHPDGIVVVPLDSPVRADADHYEQIGALFEGIIADSLPKYYVMQRLRVPGSKP